MGLMDASRNIRKGAEVRRPEPPPTDGKRPERPQPGRPGAVGGSPKIRRIGSGRMKALQERLGKGE